MKARIAAAAVSATAWFALLLQLFLSIRMSLANGHGIAHGVWLDLAYFTVLSNLLVAIVAIAAALRADGGRDLPWRGCGVSAIMLVGLGYHLLLSHLTNLDGWDRLADVMLHYVVPLTTLGWWLWFPPRRHIAPTAPLRWLLWPLLYVVYALVRGALSGFYPYHFIDVSVLGITRTLVHCAGLGLAFLVVAYLLRALARLRA